MALLKFKNESDSESDYEQVEKIFFFNWNEIKSPFDILPMEMKMMIFIYLDPEDITQFGKCSRSCQEIFRLFRPKMKTVIYRGNGISRSEQFPNCLIQIVFHQHPWKKYEIEVETMKSNNWKEADTRKLPTKTTKRCRSSFTLSKSTKTQQSTYEAVKILSKRTKPKCHGKIALEMFKSIIEFNKSSIEEIEIEASVIESRYMRSIDIYSENLKKLSIDGYFTNHPQLNQFLSVEFLIMQNFNLRKKHFPMIKSKYLRIHSTVMDKKLYEQFLKNWRDGELSDNLREVLMIGDEHEWFRYLFLDNTMLRFMMNEYGDILRYRNHAKRCGLVGSPSIDFDIIGVMIDHIDNLPVRVNLVREDF
ncbi:unnamed protein product [Caenorhabditis angaria]|uniref:F-box domain-containing protein n=1 Tax=Caenorhabditis angaria TaxID=860376 RepID=A0A9P1IVR7_9PELO|nr:unnamed protein product [Caenorhabditis angaria]